MDAHISRGMERSRVVLAVVAVAALTLPAAGPAHAAPGDTIPGGALPVAAADITTADGDLAATAREVVVSVASARGPRIHKLRARSQAEAEALAASLDAREGVTAELNATVRLAVAPRATDPAKPDARISTPTAPGSGRVGTTAVALDSEALGSEEWGMYAVGAEAAWRYTRGAGVTVAVVDSGVDTSHPDLVARSLPAIDLVLDGATGDPNGHGTHVAGIIAASLDGRGVAGLANSARILPVRVMSPDGTGDVATVAAGIVAATDAGARVINLSLGTETPSQVLADAVAHAVGAGVTVVAAAGNDFLTGNNPNYPAALPDVLAVSSLSTTGASSAFANTGTYVDLTAPGEQILSTWPGGNWAYEDGSSMAAPFVSAAAALVRAANPHFSRARVDYALTSRAQDDGSGNGRDATFGYGLLRADRSTAYAATSPYGVRAPAVQVTLRAVRSRSRLYVNLDPNRGSDWWTFRVQKRRSNGTWATLATVYRTYGSGETRTLNLSKGRYRVVVPAQDGYRSATSPSVTLTR